MLLVEQRTRILESGLRPQRKAIHEPQPPHLVENSRRRRRLAVPPWWALAAVGPGAGPVADHGGLVLGAERRILGPVDRRRPRLLPRGRPGHALPARRPERAAGTGERGRRPGRDRLRDLAAVPGRRAEGQ